MIIRQQLHRRGKVVLRAIVVGEGLQVERIKSQIANHPQYGLALIGAVGDEMTSGDLDCLGGINDIGEIVRNHRIDTLIVAAGVNQVSLVERLVRACYGLNVDFLYLPEVDLPTGGPRRIIEVGGVPLWALKETPFDGWPGLVKRTFDFIVSLLLIVMLAPIFLVIILLVKLTSKGPVFYRQRRIGLDGREFDCIKFRSMMVDAEAQTGPIWAKSGDERVTSWGRLLRRFSLDELPQLWNILRGDMSLVGPRPERPEFVQKFTEHLEGYSERHRVRTGLTGWAQVNGLRGDTSIEERLKFDRHYIENWSLGFDVKILFMTLYAVIKGENSY